MQTKYEHVKNQKQIAKHHCHWPDCDKQVPPAMWGCKKHWFTLPPILRALIWKHYKPGQEITKTPSKEYVGVALKVQEWIKQHEAANNELSRERSESV